MWRIFINIVGAKWKIFWVNLWNLNLHQACKHSSPSEIKKTFVLSLDLPISIALYTERFIKLWTRKRTFKQSYVRLMLLLFNYLLTSQLNIKICLCTLHNCCVSWNHYLSLTVFLPHRFIGYTQAKFIL